MQLELRLFSVVQQILYLICTAVVSYEYNIQNFNKYNMFSQTVLIKYKVIAYYQSHFIAVTVALSTKFANQTPY